MEYTSFSLRFFDEHADDAQWRVLEKRKEGFFDENKILCTEVLQGQPSLLRTTVHVIGRTRPRGGHKFCKYNSSRIVRKPRWSPRLYRTDTYT